MKARYKVLIGILVAEWWILKQLNSIEYKVEFWLGNVIGLAIVFLPIQIILFLLSRDPDRKEKTRFFCKILFWFINVCYVGGGIATLI